MTAAQHYTDPYIQSFRHPPPAGQGVCRVCHTGTNPGYGRCESCDVTMSQVSRPTTNVLPISLYRVHEQLWHMLRYYKDGSPTMRAELGTVVAATIARFCTAHWRCISALAGGQLRAFAAEIDTTGRALGASQPARHP